MNRAQQAKERPAADPPGGPASHMKVTPTSICHLNPVVAIEDFGERSLVLHCEDLRLAELNATARDIVRRLDGEGDLRAVAIKMAGDYEQPEDAVLTDVIAVIEQMAALDIVQCEEDRIKNAE